MSNSKEQVEFVSQQSQNVQPGVSTPVLDHAQLFAYTQKFDSFVQANRSLFGQPGAILASLPLHNDLFNGRSIDPEQKEQFLDEINQVSQLAHSIWQNANDPARLQQAISPLSQPAKPLDKSQTHSKDGFTPHPNHAGMSTIETFGNTIALVKGVQTAYEGVQLFKNAEGLSAYGQSLLDGNVISSSVANFLRPATAAMGVGEGEASAAILSLGAEETVATAAAAATGLEGALVVGGLATAGSVVLGLGAAAVAGYELYKALGGTHSVNFNETIHSVKSWLHL